MNTLTDIYVVDHN